MTTPDALSTPESATPSPSVFSTRSPVDLSPLSPVEPTSLESIPALVAAARAAQEAWSRLPLEVRAKAILKVRDRVLDRAEAIGQAISSEIGKPEAEALLGEVIPSGDVVTYWVEAMEGLLDPTEVELDKMSFPGKTGAIYREARGVIALISPWNMPVGIPLRTLIPALLAGNAVIWKPSEVSPRTGQIVKELLDDLLPAGLLQLVQGGRDAGRAVVSADVDLVVFTGSVDAGRKVAAACAARLIPCALELGGKDAAIVLADANMERAVNGIVWGGLNMCGQNCASIERVYVERAIAEEFTAKVVLAVRAIQVGRDVGPLATEAQRGIVERQVASAVAAGAELRVGGSRIEQGYGYEPTVLVVSGDDLPIMQDETFGPVIPVSVVEDAEEAIRRANASRFGLTASIWTRNIKRAEAIAARLHVGVVTVNNHAFTGALPQTPWGGQRESGYGITNSPFALDQLTRPKLVLLDRNRSKAELWWYPYTPTVRVIALAFAALRCKSSGIGRKVRAIFALLGALPKRMLGSG